MIKLFCEEKLFLLKVVGYEFPYAKESDDANWLVIEVEAFDGPLRWSARGAFLRAHELVAISQWLDSIEKNKKIASRMSFTEGELEFGFEPRDKLFILLDYGLHPKGVEYDYANDVAFSMRFHVSDVVISLLKKAIDMEIKKFPIR